MGNEQQMKVETLTPFCDSHSGRLIFCP